MTTPTYPTLDAIKVGTTRHMDGCHACFTKKYCETFEMLDDLRKREVTHLYQDILTRTREENG